MNFLHSVLQVGSRLGEISSNILEEIFLDWRGVESVDTVDRVDGGNHHVVDHHWLQILLRLPRGQSLVLGARDDLGDGGGGGGGGGEGGHVGDGERGHGLYRGGEDGSDGADNLREC